MSIDLAAAEAADSLSQRRLGEIAAQLPGATAVFRRYKLDFCCGGNVSLQEAAARRNLPLNELLGALQGLDPGAAASAPGETPALIDHILRRYHEVHRRELPELIRLAARVEAVHRQHPEVPAGLAEALRELAQELDAHMQKEEKVLFPMMSTGFVALTQPIQMMRHEHDEHGEHLRRLEHLAHQTQAPAEACATWRALYTGVRKLIDDLMEHIHLENNLLFPRFTALG